MKRIVATTTVLAFALSVASPLFAAEKKMTKTPEQICKAQAAKEHVSKHKRAAYIKSCVAKHHEAAATPK
jgi:hypothetical protein